MNIRYYLAMFLIFAGTGVSLAQNLDIKVGDKEDEKITITPNGRFYFDGAAYVDDKTDLGNGLTIPDSRIGLKARYKKWDIKVDMGFNDKKVNTKDIHLQYTFNNHSYIKLGYYGEQFGLEGWESSAWVKFMTASGSSQVFAPGRQVGITYANWSKRFYLSGGIFGDQGDIGGTAGGDDGYAFIGRFTYSPINQTGRLLHLGVASEYRTGNASGYDEDGKELPKTLSYNSNLLTRVEKRKPLNIKISDVDYQFKYVAELLGTYGPTFLQSEYYHMDVKRHHGLSTYKASGFYGQVGFLAMGGKNYKYIESERRLARPDSGSLEFVVRYNYTDLDDSKAELYGGRMSDISLAANYYVNKYIGFKLNYTYAALNNRAKVAPGEDIHIIQGRVIVTF